MARAGTTTAGELIRPKPKCTFSANFLYFCISQCRSTAVTSSHDVYSSRSSALARFYGTRNASSKQHRSQRKVLLEALALCGCLARGPTDVLFYSSQSGERYDHPRHCLSSRARHQHEPTCEWINCSIGINQIK